MCAVMESTRWPQPPVFAWLRERGNIASREMYRTFNCGIGMVVVVAPEHVQAALDTLGAHGESAWRIGTVCACSAGEPQAVVEAD
jgi:phosphoribosylformylglycinamidine cyclo-ligase